MPELAEVEHARRVWDVGLGHDVLAVDVSPNAGRVVRELDPATLALALVGQPFASSEARGKQLLFRFGSHAWMGLHLGMEGALSAEPRAHAPTKHDLLVVRQKDRCLVFNDRRHFGRIRLHVGPVAPLFWTALPPSVLSSEFTAATLRAFLTRRGRSAIKTVLLDQRAFPGVGNWMADEILWRARISPTALAGSIDLRASAVLRRTVRWVAAAAIETIDEDWRYPKTWLFQHRWEDGGRCPRCRGGLVRVNVGGRRTCGCPRCQPGFTKP